MKTTVSYHITPTRKAKIKNSDKIKVGVNVKLELSNTAVNVKGFSTLENSLSVPLVIKYRVTT